MKRSALAIDLICLVLSTLAVASAAGELPVVAPADAGLSGAKLAEVDKFMERQVAEQKLVGGIVMVAHEGKIGFFHEYGLMDREARKPMAPDTIFRIYSMSKAVTTAAALNLYDAGKIGLDDPVSKYIPGFARVSVATKEGLRPPSRPPTIRDLMLHISGLTYGDRASWDTAYPSAVKEAFARLEPMDSTNLAEMAERLSQAPLAFDPGTDWAYGVGIDVLGRVIEVASGKSLDVFLADTIFKPLDMPDTGFSVPPAKLGRFAANYSRTNGLVLIDAPAGSKFASKGTFFSGGAGLVSTARDYMRFLAMVEGGGTLDGQRVLRPGTVKLMMTNFLPEKAFPIYFGKQKRFGTGYGLGFAVRTELDARWDPDARVGECSWDGAASTHYWINPAERLIVVTMEQVSPCEWDTELGIKKTIYDALNK